MGSLLQGAGLTPAVHDTCACLMWSLLFPQVTFPKAQVPGAQAISFPWPPPPSEPVQFQLLPISRATEVLPPVTYIPSNSVLSHS